MYPCAKAEWGRDALVAFTYPSRSSTARSVLYTLYSIAANRPADQLTLADLRRWEREYGPIRKDSIVILRTG